MAKTALKWAGAVLAVVVAALLAYGAYVMLSYYRLDDNLPLEEAPAASAAVLPEAIDLAATPELTVVTANLGFGAYGPGFDFFMDGGGGSVAESAEAAAANIAGTAEAVATLRPDFVLFQEVDVDGTRSHHVNQWGLLQADLPGYASAFAQNYDSPFLAWPPSAPHGANRAGLVTFSDYRIAGTLRRSLPISDSFGKFLDLDRCYSICRTPTTGAPANAASGEGTPGEGAVGAGAPGAAVAPGESAAGQAPGDAGPADGASAAVAAAPELVLFNVHLSAYGADASIMEGQRAMLFADMERERAAGNYVIVGGDFNHDLLGASNEVFGNATATEASWAKPFDFASVPDGFIVGPKAQFDAGTFASAATCRDAGRPYDGTNDRWVMDGFVYSDNVRALGYDTLDLDFAYSDHKPVVLRFALGS